MNAGRIGKNEGVSSEDGLSIMVLNRNGAIHLKYLFESFSAHNSHGCFEFIVIDHASKDNSLEVLKDFEKELNIKIIREITNKSFAHSNNNAAGLSRYENLLFINNDIVIKNNVIPKVLNHLKNPEVGVVGIDLYYPGEGMERGPLQHSGVRFREDLRHRFFRPYNIKHPGTGRIEYVPAVTGAFLACRKTDFMKAGRFFENYFYGYEDVDLCLSIAKFTGKKCVVDHDLYAVHDESATQKKDARGAVKKRRLGNIKTLVSRYGYGLKRAIGRDIYNARSFWIEGAPMGAEQFAKIIGNFHPENYRISIKIAVPDYKTVNRWTDYYYAVGLQKQFARLGHGARIDVLPDWYRGESFGDDVVIVLRGSGQYKPSAMHINLMWDIDQNGKLTADECEGYDHIFTASKSHADKLKAMEPVPVSTLLRCVEPEGRIMYGGFMAGLQHKLSIMTGLRGSGDAVQAIEVENIENDDFARRAEEILKVVAASDARKSID